jgi:hypothetical protein
VVFVFSPWGMPTALAGSFGGTLPMGLKYRHPGLHTCAVTCALLWWNTCLEKVSFCSQSWEFWSKVRRTHSFRSLV